MAEPVKMLIVRFMLEHREELREAYRLAFPTPAPSGLTFRQRQLLDFIEAFEAEKGFSPSFDEMKDAIGLKSKSGIARLVNALEERGYIAKRSRRGRARALVLVEKRA